MNLSSKTYSMGSRAMVSLVILMMNSKKYLIITHLLNNLSFVVTKKHINKTLRKEIMKRSRLKNKTNKSGKEEDKGVITCNEIKSVN